jgi:hypothetical protein
MDAFAMRHGGAALSLTARHTGTADNRLHNGPEVPEEVGARAHRVITRSRAVDGEGTSVEVRRAGLGLSQEGPALFAGYGHPVCLELLPRHSSFKGLQPVSQST